MFFSSTFYVIVTNTYDFSSRHFKEHLTLEQSQQTLWLKISSNAEESFAFLKRTWKIKMMHA